MTQDPDAAPINPLPAAVVILALPIVLVELALIAGAEGIVGGPEAVGWRLAALEGYGFVPALFDYATQTGRLVVWDAVSLLTYPFVHLSFLHMVMVLVFLLALGKLVGEVMGSPAVFAIFFGSAVVGALVLALLTDSNVSARRRLPGGLWPHRGLHLCPPRPPDRRRLRRAPGLHAHWRPPLHPARLRHPLRHRPRLDRRGGGGSRPVSSSRRFSSPVAGRGSSTGCANR